MISKGPTATTSAAPPPDSAYAADARPTASKVDAQRLIIVEDLVIPLTPYSFAAALVAVVTEGSFGASYIKMSTPTRLPSRASNSGRLDVIHASKVSRNLVPSTASHSRMIRRPSSDTGKSVWTARSR